MGCDIHGVFQAKKDGKWQDVASTWDQDRHYFLFSWLADVRNGFGFAGVPTYTPIKPIAAPRGLPEDFEMNGDGDHPTTLEAVCPRRLEYMEDAAKVKPTVWMGDHSHSWLTADEILATPAPDKVWRTGIVERTFFDGWDGHSSPESWSGGISGRDIHVADDPTLVTDKTTHVRIFWMQPGDTLKYFTDEVKRLKDERGEVRVVFGFDS